MKKIFWHILILLFSIFILFFMYVSYLYYFLYCGEYKNSIVSLRRLSSLHIRYFPNVNIRGVNFSGMDMSGANLYKSDLRASFLIETNLRGAYLVNTNLSFADLSRADLSYATVCENGIDMFQRKHTLTIDQICKCAKIEGVKGLSDTFMLQIKIRHPELMKWWKESK